MSGWMQVEDRIFVAGHRGLVGSAILRCLERAGYRNVVVRSRAELDLTDAVATEAFFREERPAFVFLAAAKVGGILASSSFPADFLQVNLLIQGSVMEAARRHGVRRLLFLGSSSIYPREATQPIAESALLTGPLEPTNRAYALAKIAGVELCSGLNRQYGTQFLAAMPCNLYGPGDRFDAATGHVVPSMVRKAVEARRNGAKEMVLWGSGRPRRELLHSDDVAAACVFLLNLPEETYATLLPESEPPLVNVGAGEDVTIRELGELVARAAGFEGRLVFDATKPDGVMRKLMDSSRIRELGWRPKVGLEEGLRGLVREYEESTKF